MHSNNFSTFVHETMGLRMRLRTHTLSHVSSALLGCCRTSWEESQVAILTSTAVYLSRLQFWWVLSSLCVSFESFCGWSRAGRERKTEKKRKEFWREVEWTFGGERRSKTALTSPVLISVLRPSSQYIAYLTRLTSHHIKYNSVSFGVMWHDATRIAKRLQHIVNHP